MKSNSNKNQYTLEDFGYNEYFERCRSKQKLDLLNVGRVISEHKERYIVKTQSGDFEAEIVGNLIYSSQSRADFPAVGDWVGVTEYDEGKLLIHSVFPRKTILERSAVGKFGEKQIIATNIDFAFIVQSIDRDFSINRIERYLTICNNSKVKPIIIISKVDLVDDEELAEIKKSIEERIKGVPVIGISNETQIGLDELKNTIEKYKTYCLLGSSGVGKSTLINTIMGEALMETGNIGEITNRGKHVTSHRELIVLDSGGILIDNPGMREVGIADMQDGLKLSFEVIDQLSRNCRFKDCTHMHEKHCAVLDAVQNNEINKESYENYLKMQREKDHFESTEQEKRRKGKDFAKMVKKVKKIKKK
ncbi:MAG: ribosome small subunit-dependent GTPase A [Bacteroidales bacterium]|nr:ribosome small subunit-dependent GTPase A [Bacteroidales bacterium]